MMNCLLSYIPEMIMTPTPDRMTTANPITLLIRTHTKPAATLFTLAITSLMQSVTKTNSIPARSLPMRHMP
jgi:hypothetical protein